MTEPSPPPSDLQAEEAILGSICVAQESYDRVRGVLEAHHFYVKRNETIYAAVGELYNEGVAVDAVTIARRLRDLGQLDTCGGSPYLGYLLYSVPYVQNVEHYANIVRELWRVRTAMNIAQKYAAAARAHGSDEVQPWLETFELEVADVVSGASKMALLHAHPIAVAAYQALKSAADGTGEKAEQSTGFRECDKLIGGLHNGDLYIVAGRPGMGKTSFVIGVARAIAAKQRTPRPKTEGAAQLADAGADVDEWTPGNGVAFFSLEMPKDQMAIRLAAITSGVDTFRLRRGNLSPKDWADLGHSIDEIRELPIWVDDSAGITLSQIRSRSRQLQAAIKNGRAAAPAKRLGLVVIDYLQLMQAVTLPGRTRESEVAAMSRGLKLMAKELDVPVIALSQLNRSVETRGGKDHRPELSDLRESGAIEQDADEVMFIYRPGYYDPENQELKGLAEVIVGKNRHGPTGTGKLYFDGRTTKFADLADAYYDDFDDYPDTGAGF